MISKTVLVTGASKGIGKEIAKKLAGEGYNVCINYNKSRDEAIELKKELLNKGYNVDDFKADVSNREEVDQMIEFVIKRFGSIDVIVNNAGICEYKLFVDILEEDLKRMFDTTILGTFNVTQSALKKYMIKNQCGNIINIASMWGIVGAACETNYSTMKSGVIGMTKALAKEMGPSNIRVNAIAPGIIDTDMNKNLSNEEVEEFVEDIPLGRIGKVEDVAELVSFLASEKSSYITGQIISTNGGAVI